SKTPKKTASANNVKETTKVGTKQSKLVKPPTNKKVPLKPKIPAPNAPKNKLMGRGGIFGIGLSSGLTALAGGSTEDVGTAAITSAAFVAAQKASEKLATKVASVLAQKAVSRAVPFVGTLLSAIDVAEDLVGALSDPNYEGMAFSGVKAAQRKADPRGYAQAEALKSKADYEKQHGVGSYDQMMSDYIFKGRNGIVSSDPQRFAQVMQDVENSRNMKDAQNSPQTQSAFRNGFSEFTSGLFSSVTDMVANPGNRRGVSIGRGTIIPNYGTSPGGGEGMYASRGWFRETQANRRAFNLANDAVEKPKKADDLLAGPKGNYTFNARDQHYVLPDGQVLSTNRGINTLPESKGIRDGRFASTNNTSNDNTEKLLQQILSALQNGSGGSPTVINNTTRLVSPENFVTGGVFT
ncbi:MAG TPA: hypothetical protein P5023_05945, partial [Bacteroidales bacterium]|nr:hypothetical protein [Bacteroidales bacterium]